jgi:hypothetical protein
MLTAILGRVRSELAGWVPDLREALAAREPAEVVEAVLTETEANLMRIVETTPDPGWTAPHMRAFTISGAIYVAFYLALAARGRTAAWVWEVCDAATRAHFARMGAFEKKLASDGMFGFPMKALSRWVAGRSQRAPVGDWVFRFVEGEEGFAYGVDYERCAIRELAVRSGAADFAPYICLADIAGSEAFGWGLQRSETLAQGGRRCDFRFTQGGPTRVRVHLPVVDANGR